jgi:gliding motility-associated-like protein
MYIIKTILLFFCLFICCCNKARAQSPTISSFTPISGPIGSTVIITGTNFDPTPANNIVMFNGTAAPVTASTATSITTSVPTGVTTGPITVTVGANTATSASNFTVAPFNVSFTAPLGVTVGSTPREVVVGDIDGDGHQDLVASNFGSGSISFLKGIGNGCFESPQNFNTGSNSHGLALADLNQDSRLDLVVTKGSSFASFTSLSVLLGNGISFDPQNDYNTAPTPRSPNHVTIGDPNKDGSPDIIVANNNPSGSFSILYNNGDGTFATGVDFPSANGSAFYVATDDVNGDSFPDVAIASYYTGGASVYINDGMGGFAPETTYPSAAGPHYVVLKDLSGDGRPEMIVANATGNSISVFLNDGAGLFSVPVIYPTENYPTTISVADMDNDGRLDLVIGNANSGTVTAFPGDGAGGFGAYKSFPVSGLPYSVVTGDFDEDGNLDVVAVDVSSNKITLLRTLSNTCIPSIASFTPDLGPVGTTVTITGTNFSTTPANNIVTFNGTTAVVTASTLTSITTTVPTGASTGPIEVTVGGNTAASSTNFTVIVCPVSPGVVSNSGCSGTAITLTASGGTNGQYRWYTVATGGTPIAGQTNDTYLTPSLTITTSYYAAIHNGTCESTRTEVIATVIPLPTAPGVQPVNPVCPGSNVPLTATGGTDGQYRWYDGTTLITGEVNSTYTVMNLSSTKTFQIAIDDGTCESNKTSVIATVQNCTPPAVASTTATAFIEGIVTIELGELVSDEEDNIDPSRLQITSPPTSGAFAELVGFELRINYAGFPFVGTDEVGLEACDLTDLCTQQQITIELNGDITVHNAVSPDGNGKNEFLTIQYIEILPETQSNKVFIYNRWGDEVFSVSDYNNNDRVFKGDSNKGNKLPVGTYFYKIVFPNGKKTLTGFLELKY